MRARITLLAVTLLLGSNISRAEGLKLGSELYPLQAEILSSELEHPWGISFLPDGDLLVTERAGRLRRVHDDRLVAQPISGVPEVVVKGQGGLLDVVLHPDFENNQWIYLSYAGRGPGGVGTEVARARLDGMRLTDLQVIFRALPKSSGGHHFGGRLVFADDGTLFISLGDRGDKERAQDRNDHAGSLIRVNDDGSVPADNPFADGRHGRGEIYTLGNRNMQGMSIHPQTREVWTIEHGPQGGDEVNVMRAGVNYGWPVITYGVNYVIGTRIGEGTEKPGMAQPLHYWVPSIATSGMDFYTGDLFPEWRDNLLVGSLKFGLLVRLVLDGEKVVHEERMLDNRLGRIRTVRQGPQGEIYLLTDESAGKLIRLTPQM